MYMKPAKDLFKPNNFWQKKTDNHHHVALPTQISLMLSRHLSLSSIAPGRSSRLHPVTAQSCCIQILADRRTLARLYEGVHRSTSIMRLTSPAVSCMSGSSNLDSFHDGW